MAPTAYPTLLRVMVRLVLAMLTVLVPTIPTVATDDFWAPVDHVYDGDTLTVILKAQDGKRYKQRVRMLHIDTAELGGARCDLEHRLALEQRDKLRSMVGQKVYLRVEGKDRYGRLLAEVFNEAGEDLNMFMLEKAGARRYEGGHRAGWCK